MFPQRRFYYPPICSGFSPVSRLNLVCCELVCAIVPAARVADQPFSITKVDFLSNRTIQFGEGA
jgi:hypothetical protein